MAELIISASSFLQMCSIKILITFNPKFETAAYIKVGEKQ